MKPSDPLLCHNYSHLIKRWRALCRQAGLRMVKIGVTDGYPCFQITSPVLRREGGVYLSAGIHGDEPGAVLGLLTWAEHNISVLSSLPLLIYPCLSPWGLENNSRWDANGQDLNRLWDASSPSPLIAKIMQELRTYNFSVSVCLHEDYEGQGAYLYAPGGKKEVRARADSVLDSVEKIMPRDPRKRIDGRKCARGLIFPRPTCPPKEGIPEALFLYRHCGGVNFTLETPSERDISVRAQGHAAMIEAAVTW